jgi:polyphosphate kinase 2
MIEPNFSDIEVMLLNQPKGLLSLLFNKEVNLRRSLRYVRYEKQLERLQAELIKLQNWVYDHNEKVIVIFEGRDSAGKGGAIRRITEFLNPRKYRIVALPKPDENEAQQWYFQRYVNTLPKSGEIVFYDRSWYNRAIVEPVNGFCSQEEYQVFMNHVNDFEKMLVESGFRIIKFYFSISKEEQQARFKDIILSPEKKWKYSEVDRRAIELWDVYTEYKLKMFEKTNTEICPWNIIEGNRKTEARIKAIKHLLSTIPYNFQKIENL